MARGEGCLPASVSRNGEILQAYGGGGRKVADFCQPIPLRAEWNHVLPLMESNQHSGDDPLESGCIVEGADSTWNARDKRRLRRYQVAGSRPVLLRPVIPQSEEELPWLVADILDISLGGLCLLLSGGLELSADQCVELDLRAHPQFPWTRLTVEVRWWISAGTFTTLGIVFPAPLPSIPRLEQERRGVRRDPNGQG